MIICRSPMRISLGGGGTDLPSYYREHEGVLLAGAINKYVYITIHPTFREHFLIKYSQLEETETAEEIKHPILREALVLLGLQRAYLEITSMADIPAGTGLGSSGSFTTALLKALHTHKHETVTAHQLASQACHIEIERLEQPIGKQDQYIASFGGLTCFRFNKDDSVTAEPLRISSETRANLEDGLMMFFTGYSRSASAILKDQDTKTRTMNAEMLDNLHFIKEVGQASMNALVDGAIDRFASLMDTHWQHKKARSSGMSNEKINGWYDLARNNGALGGKLVGAGGGGFLLFYSADKPRLRRTMLDAGLREVRFQFEPLGTTVLSS